MVLRVLAVLSLAASVAWGQGSHKLNGPLSPAPTVEGDVEDAQLSRDGRYLVYLARQDDPVVAELYGVPLDGSSVAARLSGPLVDGGAIDDFLISPDSRRVVYQADQEQANVHELFSVPIEGGASPTRLNPSDTHGLFGYRISPDGQRVVFFDSLDFRLRSVPIAGGDVLALHSLHPGGYVLEFQFSADGKRVLYTADPDGLSGVNLYSVSIDGDVSPHGHARRHESRPVRLNAPLVPGEDIFSFRVGSGGHAVYQVIGSFDLYGVRVDGTAPAARLNPIPVPGGHVTYTGYEISPDGERVVYRADQDQDEVYELYSVAIEGGGSVKLSEGGDVAQPGFEIDPGGTRVVYLADRDTDGVTELYSVPIDASSGAVELSSVRPALESLESFRISPDGARVVYLTVRDCGVTELFSVPIDRSAEPILIEGRACGNGIVEEYELEYQISPDGRWVVCLTDGRVDGVLVRELFSVPIDCASSSIAHARSVRRVRLLRLNAPLPRGANVGDPSGPSGRFSFAIRPDGREVLYRADQESVSVQELFGVSIEGGSAPRKLNPPLALGPPPGDVAGMELSPDGGRVVFRADQELDEEFELFCVAIAGRPNPVKIQARFQDPGSVSEYRITPDGQRIVYLARLGEAVHLFSAPHDGGAQALDLSGPLVAGGNVLSFAISPGGERVAYVADQEADGVNELFCVATDGSDGPIKLNAPLPAGGSVKPCESQVHPHSHFTSDGERVVYLADQDVDNVFELYCAAADGAMNPVKLNAPLAAGGDVISPGACFLIGAHGRVVYLADQDSNDVFEVYGAPLDGSGPIRLNAALVSGGDVSAGVDGVHLDPPGENVVYRADQETDEQFEFFAVPIDGSAAPVRLNGDMVPAGDVSSLAPRFSPGGARVLFRADQVRDGVFDLHSVALDGSAPAVPLSALPFHSRHVQEFEITADGECVVYRADQHTDQVFELYVVPLDGSAPAARLLAPDTRVEAFRLAPDTVVFAAELGGPGTSLYAASIPGNGAPLRLSGPMAGAGVRIDPPGIWISAHGRYALYIADQDTAGVQELYASPLSRPRTRSP